MCYEALVSLQKNLVFPFCFQEITAANGSAELLEHIWQPRIQEVKTSTCHVCPCASAHLCASCAQETAVALLCRVPFVFNYRNVYFPRWSLYHQSPGLPAYSLWGGDCE